MPTLHGSLIGLDPYELTGVRKLAELTGLELGLRPSKVSIQRVFDAWGTETAFEQNAPAVAQALKLDSGTVPDDEVLDLLDQTTTLDKIDIRSLDSHIQPTGSLVAIATGATVRWMEYRIRQMQQHVNNGYSIDKVYAVANHNRPCSLPTEVNHPVIVALQEDLGQQPMEHHAMERLLTEAQFPAEFITGPSLEANIGTLMDRHPELAHARTYVPVNGNATYIALAVRRFIRQSQPSFDGGLDQFFFSQRTIPLARTPEQAVDTLHYQRPLTVFSGLARLMNELYLLPRS